MFILPPNCIVPSATSLTISPVFPNFLYFISHTPSAANENCDGKSRICPNSAETSKRFRVHTAPDCDDVHPTLGRTSPLPKAPAIEAAPCAAIRDPRMLTATISPAGVARRFQKQELQLQLQQGRRQRICS